MNREILSLLLAQVNTAPKTDQEALTRALYLTFIAEASGDKVKIDSAREVAEDLIAPASSEDLDLAISEAKQLFLNALNNIVPQDDEEAGDIVELIEFINKMIQGIKGA